MKQLPPFPLLPSLCSLLALSIWLGSAAPLLAVDSPPAPEKIQGAGIDLTLARQSIRAAGLARPLVPTGQGSLADAGRLGGIVSGVWGAARPGPEPTPEMIRQQAAELEQFVADHPASPFAPSIHVELGDYFVRAAG